LGKKLSSVVEGDSEGVQKCRVFLHSSYVGPLVVSEPEGIAAVNVQTHTMTGFGASLGVDEPSQSLYSSVECSGERVAALSVRSGQGG